MNKLPNHHAGTTPPAGAARADQRRGVAMLLALCAVATVTIVTASYVASRESAPLIGDNALHNVVAKWANTSAGDLAVAALETGLDPAALADPEKFMDAMTVAGADVKVSVTDANGDPPPADATEVVVTITATKDGLTHTSQRIVKLPPQDEPIGDALDPELNEFGVYARSWLTIESGAVVGPWQVCPNPLGDVNVGLGFTSDSALEVSASAGLVSTKLFVPGAATSTLKARIGAGGFAGGAVLPNGVPLLGDPVPSQYAGSTVQAIYNLILSLTSRLLNPGVYQDLTISSGKVVTMSGSPAFYSCSDLVIENSGVLLISGDITLYVRDDLIVQSLGAIELADAASRVRIVVADDLVVDNGGVGVSRTVARDANRAVWFAPYIDPNRVQIVGLSSAQGGAASANYYLRGRSVVCAAIHSPNASLDISESASLAGRVTANVLRVRTGSCVMVDASLNKQTGFTAAEGPLYKSPGVLKNAVAAVLSNITASTTIADLEATMAVAFVPDDSVKVEPGDEEVTPRTADAAQAKPWPATAMALEEAATGGSTKGMLFDVSNLSDAVAEVVE